ncbi:leucine-rich repeat-containing protein 71 [Clupea harengus]|uniref:Leucine-rich repeat-containing protein 71 n=1 Tax=Clupea harengus TaxID=7950 RepID=A0A8M1KVZ7_CLUHA|nr:leucine-rich repeat-containing protein 71 [Clupea harengus]
MKKKERIQKDKFEKSAEDINSKTAVLPVQDKCPAQNIDDYQCTGHLEADFLEVTALLGMSEIPTVTPRPSGALSPAIRKGIRGEIEVVSKMATEIQTHGSWSPKRQLLVELESEDPRSVKAIKVFGWKVDEVMTKALNKILPSLHNLQTIHFWQADLTPHILLCLKTLLPLCCNLRTVVLEGNPMAENSYHLLMSEDSNIAHLSLRHNQIGEEGARLIGSALSTIHSANKNLVSLNLAFNSMGDAGARHIAWGLRLNRSLLCLSLANNHVGDAGAAILAEILSPFPLTHEEIVERRRLKIERDQSPTQDLVTDRPLSVPSSSSVEQSVSKAAKVPVKKKEKASGSQIGSGKKEEPKLAKKPSETKAQRSRQKPVAKDRPPSVVDSEDKNNSGQSKSADGGDVGSPLLDPGVQHIGGEIIMPGNTALTSLNLSGNLLTEKSMQLFYSSLQTQSDGGGLLRLCLSKNCFPSDCESFLKIQELMTHRDPLNKSSATQAEEGHGPAE